jgi:acyl-CoA thioester hydrolase
MSLRFVDGEMLMVYKFKIDCQVRDYECDMQGYVNNAVYQNYLEHARHGYLKQLGINFAELAKQKVNLVVVRAELDYKFPLQSNDNFWIGLNLERVSKIRFKFLQDIYRYPDDKLVLESIIIGTSLNEKGRPQLFKEVDRVLPD